MDKKQTQVLQWARRVRDWLVERDLKSDVAELSAIRKELDDAIGKLTANAAAQEAMTKQSRVQTTEITRIRATLRDAHLKPIIRMSRMMELEINGTEITFVLPEFRVNSERLAAAGDAMVTALNVVGPRFVARGFAANFVEQLSTATKALRDAIDQRAAQRSRRIGTTAAMERDATRVTQLVRVIDPLVRAVIQSNPELLASWDSVATLRQSTRRSGAVAPPSAASASPATLTVSSDTGHAPQAAA